MSLLLVANAVPRFEWAGNGHDGDRLPVHRPRLAIERDHEVVRRVANTIARCSGRYGSR